MILQPEPKSSKPTAVFTTRNLPDYPYHHNAFLQDYFHHNRWPQVGSIDPPFPSRQNADDLPVPWLLPPQLRVLLLSMPPLLMGKRASIRFFG